MWIRLSVLYLPLLRWSALWGRLHTRELMSCRPNKPTWHTHFIPWSYTHSRGFLLFFTVICLFKLHCFCLKVIVKLLDTVNGHYRSTTSLHNDMHPFTNCTRMEVWCISKFKADAVTDGLASSGRPADVAVGAGREGGGEIPPAISLVIKWKWDVSLFLPVSPEVHAQHGSTKRKLNQTDQTGLNLVSWPVDRH